MLQMAKGKEQPVTPKSEARPASDPKLRQVNNVTTSKTGGLYAASSKSGHNSSKAKAAAKSDVAERPEAMHKPSQKITAVPQKYFSVGLANSACEMTHVGSKPPSQAQAVSGTKKKLSFKDVLKQASSIEKSKLEVNLRVTNQRPEKAHRKPTVGSDLRSSVKGMEAINKPPVREGRSGLRGKSVPSCGVVQAKSACKSVSETFLAPFAQPSAEIKARLEQRKKEREQQKRSRSSALKEDDLDDFIVSDDDEDVNGGSHKVGSEIWSLFNRRPKHSYYDEYDSADEMEATGWDIFDEERRSAAQARREDIEEERRLEALAKNKKMRRM